MERNSGKGWVGQNAFHNCLSLSIYIYIIYNLQFETSLGFHSPAAEGHPIS